MSRLPAAALSLAATAEALQLAVFLVSRELAAAAAAAAAALKAALQWLADCLAASAAVAVPGAAAARPHQVIACPAAWAVVGVAEAAAGLQPLASVSAQGPLLRLGERPSHYVALLSLQA